MSNILHLVMIVKDCENTIPFVLNNIAPYIHEYTILDTGSIDKTVSVIKKSLQSKKGNIYFSKFIDFSYNRNEALIFAEKTNTSKYFLMLDDSYLLSGHKKLLQILSSETRESYSLNIKNDLNSITYFSPRIFLASKKIRYKYKVHEIPVLEETSNLICSEEIFITDVHNTSSIERSKKRYNNDLEFLFDDLKFFKNKLDKDRLLYYIGRTYYSLEDYSLANKYFWMVKFNYRYSALYYLGNILCKQDKFKDAELIFMLCMKDYPNRAEPVYKLALEYYMLFNSKGVYGGEQLSSDEYLTKAYEILQKAINIDIPNINEEIELDIYTKEIPYLYAEVCMMKRDLKNAMKSIQKGLSYHDDDTRFHNILYSISDHEKNEFIELDKPLIVFHSSNNILWNPNNVHLVGSGSEIMVVNMAEQFMKKGYRVFVFGKFLSEYDSYENIYEGVEYIDHSRYNEICSTYKIKTLIVSRDPKNLIFYDNIESVFLWLHDLQPFEPFFQVHRTKFKGVLCLSEFHRQKFLHDYKFLKDAVIVTRNAIHPYRFSENIEKTPYSFIYTSSPDRGLDIAVNMFNKIVKTYPMATFNIFCDKSKMTIDLLYLISENKQITLHERISQNKIPHEYLKSSVWFYPTTFDETYCISALEAQAAGCLCVSVNKGSLTEIIGDRGIMVNGDIKNEKVQDDLLNKLYFVFSNKIVENILRNKAKKWALNQTFENLVNDWIKIFN